MQCAAKRARSEVGPVAAQQASGESAFRRARPVRGIIIGQHAAIQGGGQSAAARRALLVFWFSTQSVRIA